jgi:hypothetical protein
VIGFDHDGGTVLVLEAIEHARGDEPASRLVRRNAAVVDRADRAAALPRKARVWARVRGWPSPHLRRDGIALPDAD